MGWAFEYGRHREALTHITPITPNRERLTFPKGKEPSRRCANRPNAIQDGRASFRHTKVRGVQRAFSIVGLGKFTTPRSNSVPAWPASVDSVISGTLAAGCACYSPEQQPPTP